MRVTLVAEGTHVRVIPPEETRRLEIGTESAQVRAQESHSDASKVDSVEHEGGGWYPTLDGWGVPSDRGGGASGAERA